MYFRITAAGPLAGQVERGLPLLVLHFEVGAVGSEVFNDARGAGERGIVQRGVAEIVRPRSRRRPPPRTS